RAFCSRLSPTAASWVSPAWTGSRHRATAPPRFAEPSRRCHAPPAMAEVPALLVFGGGIVLVVAGAELFFDGVLSVAARLRISAFVLTAVVSGFELENLAAGIAANARGLS